MDNLKVCVLMRCNKKTGKIDTTMTSLGNALLNMWALQNTTTSKATFVFEQETGKILFEAYGTKDGFPKTKKAGKDGDLGTCDEIGIPIEALQAIKDDRF